jgi:hypothetical protein
MRKKERRKMKNENKKVITKIKGKVAYVTTEDNVARMKIAVDEETFKRLEEETEIFENSLTWSDPMENCEDYECCFNVKSNLDFKPTIYDRKGSEIDYTDFPINPNAIVLLEIVIKEMPYRRKNYTSAYLKTAVIIENGEPLTSQKTSFDDFKDMLNEEDVEF